MKGIAFILMLELIIAGCAGQAFEYNVTKVDGRKDEIKVDGNIVNVYHSFEKPTPCNTIDYDVSMEGKTISVYARGKPFEGQCVQMISSETVDIMMKLGKGEYTIQFYDYWSDGKEPSATADVMVG